MTKHDVIKQAMSLMGQSKSAKKRAAARKNIEKARVALAAKRVGAKMNRTATTVVVS